MGVTNADALGDQRLVVRLDVMGEVGESETNLDDVRVAHVAYLALVWSCSTWKNKLARSLSFGVSNADLKNEWRLAIAQCWVVRWVMVCGGNALEVL